MKISKSQWIRVSVSLIALAVLMLTGSSSGAVNVIPDTDQVLFYDDQSLITEPGEDEPFYGQDATYFGIQQAYQDNGDGTVTDLNTGLMWQQGLAEKMTWAEAMAGADTCAIGGYTDWRLPTIKELYSLIQFSGTDPSGGSTINLIPFIDDEYFQFEYGDTLSGERLIDAQYWSSTVYQGLTMAGDTTAFGVNFADGRIKGYPRDQVGPSSRNFQMTSFVRYVRGDSYGDNQYQDNGDGTVTDLSTGLMWQQSDDGTGRNWEESLQYAESLDLAGYHDWRLPDAHELQSIVDYSRSLQSTDSPAIDPVFSCTQITDEGGNPNYGFYWTGTTHAGSGANYPGDWAVYVAFGEALGWMSTPDSTYELWDVHGAGAQRSDPKSGDPGQYPHGHGPQGDVVRIYNLVRCVRDAGSSGTEGSTEPSEVSLSVAGCNPCQGEVNLILSLPGSGSISVTVFDSCGRRVGTLAESWYPAGTHWLSWSVNPSGQGCGLYFFRAENDTQSSTVKVIITGY